MLLEEIFSPFLSDSETPCQFPWTEILELVAENHCASPINVLVLAENVNYSKWEEIRTSLVDVIHIKVFETLATPVAVSVRNAYEEFDLLISSVWQTNIVKLGTAELNLTNRVKADNDASAVEEIRLLRCIVTSQCA